MKKIYIIAALMIVFGIIFIFNPEIFNSNSISLSGDFWRSQWGLRIISAYIIGAALLFSGITLSLIIFSYYLFKNNEIANQSNANVPIPIKNTEEARAIKETNDNEVGKIWVLIGIGFMIFAIIAFIFIITK